MDYEPSLHPSELPAAQSAYQKIMGLLLNGQFRNGEAIRENILSKQLGLGRGAVREALNRLVSLSVLDYTPYCGYRLHAYSIKDYLHWFDFRLALEPRALKLSYCRHWEEREKFYAAMAEILEYEGRCLENNDLDGSTRSDFSFHLKIVESSGNPLITNSYLHVSLPFLTSCHPSNAVSEDENVYFRINMNLHELKLTHQGHLQLLEEISHGNPDKAVEALAFHISFSRNNFYDFIAWQTLSRCPASEQASGLSVDDIVQTMIPKN